MNDYYFTFRSITTARLAGAVLQRAGISYTLLRTPKSMAGQGCGYSLRLRQSQGGEAAAALRRAEVRFQRIYLQAEPPVEVIL